jgi:hypothetical protein
MRFINRSQIFLMLIKYDLFSSNINKLYIFEPKMGTIMLHMIFFNVWRSWHNIKNCEICMFRWEGKWKCFKILWHFKIPKVGLLYWGEINGQA